MPQGSILGPILFIIYINDLHNCTNLNLLSFADDTTLFTSGHNRYDISQFVNTELMKVNNWLCSNRLKLNKSKTNFVVFCPPGRHINFEQYPIKINNEVINQTNTQNKKTQFKFLGICLDEHLSWKNHVNYICNKISRSIYMINRVKHFMPKPALKLLYYTLVESHINYGLPVWGNSIHINNLVNLQKRAVRVINKKSYRSHTDPIYKSLEILKVQDLYELNVLLFMHDYKFNKLPVSFADNFNLNSESLCRVTRQSNLYHIARPRTNFSSKLPSYIFPTIWNKQINNVKTFNSKKKLKLHLKTYFHSKLSLIHI